MTYFSHVDPKFGSVFSIEAINEPLMDATRTPNFGQCGFTFLEMRLLFQLLPTVQKDFVETVRATENTLLPDYASAGNITAALHRAAEFGKYSDEVKSVLKDSVPVLHQMLLKYGDKEMIYGFLRPDADPLITKYGIYSLHG